MILLVVLVVSRLAIGIVAIGLPILIACLLVFLPPSSLSPQLQPPVHYSPPVVLLDEEFSSPFNSEYQQQQQAPLRHLQASISKIFKQM